MFRLAVTPHSRAACLASTSVIGARSRAKYQITAAILASEGLQIQIETASLCLGTHGSSHVIRLMHFSCATGKHPAGKTYPVALRRDGSRRTVSSS